MTRWIGLAVAVAGAILWAVITSLPPAPRGSDAPPADFSATRAFPTVEAVARAPRPVGSPENARVRAYLIDRLRALGAEVSEQPFPLPAKSAEWLTKLSGKPQGPITAHNIVAVFPGRDRTLPALMLMAHHDSVVGSPGAADDGVGLATAIEVMRAMRTGPVAERDIIVLFSDSEEMGLDGARVFVERHPLARRLGMIINLESRGTAGRVTMFETGANNGAQMKLYGDVVDRPAANSLSVLVYDMMPNSSDYTMAKKRGIPGFNFAMVGDAWGYHSPLSTPEALSLRSLQHMGDQALALTRAMALSRTLPVAEPNAAFADVLGHVLIAYPPSFGWVILIVAAALIGAALWRTRPGLGAVAGGAVTVVALLMHSALLLTALNLLSGSGDYNYYDRLAAIPRLEAQATLAILAMLALLPFMRRPEIRLAAIGPALALGAIAALLGGPLVMVAAFTAVALAAALLLPARAGDHGGAILLLLVAAVAVQATLPTGGPAFAWPLLLGAIGFAARAFLPGRAGGVVTVVVGIAGIGHLLAQGHFIFLAVGAEMPLASLAVLFAGLPLILPLLPDALPRWPAVLLVVAAVAIALWVRLDAPAASMPTYSAVEARKSVD